jgi:hypothetical protein
MLIRFSKADGAPVLTCVRDDGSLTYAKSAHAPFFGPHDLMHYAVESTLNLRDAFFGLIARGKSIAWFAEPGSAAKLPPEALHTELMVNQFLLEASSGTACGAEEFNRALSASAAQASKEQQGLPRRVTDAELTRIRECFAELLGRYRALKSKECLELRLPCR